MQLKFTKSPDRMPLFSFAVVADTHVNESDSDSSSPFATNHRANQRARYVFAQLAGLNPAPSFVVHLGDIVHPVPGLPTFNDAVAAFKEIASPLNVPLHLIPGNHDVGDKRVSWMPADQISNDYLSSYRNLFGKDYYGFSEGPVRFLMLNSLLLNSGLADEAAQRQWFEDELQQQEGGRVFVFMHYPPFIFRPDEPGNYDNIDEPARSWLMDRLEMPQVEAIFAGHVHNYWYDNIGSAEVYMLPSTAFVRHDFSEFYKVAPDVEFGRGDVERFGYFWVDVFAADDREMDDRSGHVAYSVRTLGAELSAGGEVEEPAEYWLAHPKCSSFAGVGVELRHPWAESMQIAATGGVQEFGRKWARNDYPLLALTEMGVRLCKIPDIDVTDADSRDRMAIVSAANQSFIVTSIGLPSSRVLDQDLAAVGVVAFEVNATRANFESSLERYAEVRKTSALPIYFAKILANDDSRFDGTHFTHFVKAGFNVDELENDRALLARAVTREAIDGVCVRHEIDDSLAQTAARTLAFAAALNCRALVSIKLAADGVATERADDRLLAASAAQAMVLSRCDERVVYVFDTFMDVDRGYFPRHGFINRRFNPRPAAAIFARVNAMFSGVESLRLVSEEAFDVSGGERRAASAMLPAGTRLLFEADDDTYALIVASRSTRMAWIEELGVQVGTTVVELIDGRNVSAADYVDAEQGALLDCLLVKL